MNQPTADQPVIRNRLILSLRPAALEFLQKRLITRSMSVGEVIYEEGAPFTHAVFPHEGVISLMSQMQSGRTVEKASIGYEGFVGFALILGGGNAVSRSTVRIAGYASWLAIEDLDEALAEFPCVSDVMLRYSKSLITQLLESVACNSLHTAQQRIARWLLHAHDRVQGDTFYITQEALSEVLGLRRATVSEAWSQLQHKGVISYSRGCITIHHRQMLEETACECFHRIRGGFAS
ncbi:Crp/Fnr family transcriptional regulator [Microvirga alba]|uniref:Crp/Fnr family transcriptional regulator n=1 Tax=Microvirga alba TaxID=2791025 RepID=UPI002D21A9FD|nr:Crp/Fnr family transcriptional regulator [Microvirga alba]